MDFRNKIIAHRIEENVTGIVFWRNEQFYVKIKDSYYPIFNGTSNIGAKKLYSLPNNNYHNPWTETVVTKPELLVIRDKYVQFWGKYKPGMKIEGKLINNVFYDKSYFSSNTTKS